MNNPNKIRVLIVDDEPQIFETLGSLLRDEGYEVDWAKDGAEFHDKALQTKPDVVILDIVLRKENGTQAYNRLLSDGFDKKTPIIFLSGLLPEGPVAPVSPGRTYALHSKPFNYDHLLHDIRALVKPKVA